MILVVDDNPILISWLRDVIEESGYYYDYAPDAVSSLFKASRIYYAMALIDIRLHKGINGIELAKQIKTLPEPYCEVPMVVMTGSDYRLTDEDPFVDILHKPFLPRDLEAMIQRVARPPIKDLHLATAAMSETGESRETPTSQTAQEVAEDPEVIPQNPKGDGDSSKGDK